MLDRIQIEYGIGISKKGNVVVCLRTQKQIEGITQNAISYFEAGKINDAINDIAVQIKQKVKEYQAFCDKVYRERNSEQDVKVKVIEDICSALGVNQFAENTVLAKD